MFRKIILSVFVIAIPGLAQAKLNVITTTPDLAAIAHEVGGDDINVDSIAKGTQDPHYVEAKPSYMVKVNRADLVIAIGLDLEVGWIPPILNGARNPKVMKGSSGYLEVGPLVQPLEVPSGTISRAEGDVHPYGNPHVTLDPVRDGEIAIAIAERLGQLDSSHAEAFGNRAKAYQRHFAEKSKAWQERIAKSSVKKIVTYHKTLTYFFDRFKLTNPAILEPKPGIPPTSGHTIEVINLIRDQKIPLIMVENFFDPTVTNKIKSEVPSVRVAVVPVSVDGAPGIKSLDDLFERLVSTVEGK